MRKKRPKVALRITPSTKSLPGAQSSRQKSSEGNRAGGEGKTGKKISKRRGGKVETVRPSNTKKLAEKETQTREYKKS